MTKDQFDSICETLNLKTEMGRAALTISLDNIRLFDRKQQDYGSQNISKFGEFGVLVRCNDKVERLNNLVKNNLTPNNESREDNWADVSNYGLIGQMIVKGLWK